ncbi:hypothetical protein DPV79_23560 [Burkholderia reimsis]|uniref:Uncharacterized protein n=1 Tax=Burkholderia reimsis TaxID=2234132 RepID=A0A365QR42_9BURK|nr:hypothetical protein [Burkholderia reimsis]RBB36980.1 hypothetical protein DPV79_23560 [Burkholderia reimsis]
MQQTHLSDDASVESAEERYGCPEKEAHHERLPLPPCSMLSINSALNGIGASRADVAFAKAAEHRIGPAAGILQVFAESSLAFRDTAYVVDELGNKHSLAIDLMMVVAPQTGRRLARRMQKLAWGCGAEAVHKTAIFEGEYGFNALMAHRRAAEHGRIGALSAGGAMPSPISVYCAIPYAPVAAGIEALGADGADALSSMFAVSDLLPYHENYIDMEPDHAETLAKFDEQLDVPMRKKRRAMCTGRNLVPQRLTLSSGAAHIVASEREAAQAFLAKNVSCPTACAVPARLPGILCSIGGLLHLLEGDEGSIVSEDTMVTAYLLSLLFSEEFERAVTLSSAYPIEYPVAQKLFGAMRRLVARDYQARPWPPFLISMRALCTEVVRDDLTEARVRRVVELMREWRWIWAFQDGADADIALKSDYFEPLTRPQR